ncbi:MAG: type II toxin-antitoxin system Phd/YefM family antitoxin [Betaproteobacteria bacterium]|nr:type II toxin-antitoxin system Phd/YefM family antitoxin [Betaproteobacteria bacterium]
MGAIAYTQFRRHLAEVFDQAEHEPVTVTRADGKNFVLISEDEWAARLETEHLLSSAANREHLEASLKQAAEGKTVKVRLDDL